MRKIILTEWVSIDGFTSGPDNDMSFVGESFSDERLAVIDTALRRNLDQFQIVRDLEIDDAVEPAPIFDARRR